MVRDCGLDVRATNAESGSGNAMVNYLAQPASAMSIPADMNTESREVMLEEKSLPRR
jgi:hypothetical protein